MKASIFLLISIYFIRFFTYRLVIHNRIHTDPIPLVNTYFALGGISSRTKVNFCKVKIVVIIILLPSF